MALRRNDFSVGFFLTLRYIRGANRWTTVLITFVMVLTFLNLTVIGGLLEGIIVGSFVGLRDRAIGGVFISSKSGEVAVGRTQYILRDLRSDARVSSFSPRYSARAEVITEDDVYQITDANNQRKSVTTTVLGIDPEEEQRTTNLPGSLLEGSYFSSSAARREILIGSALLERHSPFGAEVLSGVHPGDFVFMRIGSGLQGGFGYDADDDRSGRTATSSRSTAGTGASLRKYLVRGVYRTKAGELDLAIIMSDDEVRAHNPIPGNNVNSIAIRLHNQADATAVRDDLMQSFGRYAKIETVEDAIGPFLGDIRTVFKMLGSVVGAIGLAVASITIFIIIFVTAVSRSKYIGILKAIGVTPNALRISYVLYAMSFALAGSLLGFALLYGVLVPFFDANPIPFPFSDGILYITSSGVLVQIGLLFIATLIAGVIPAHRVVRRPAIEAVRGK